MNSFCQDLRCSFVPVIRYFLHRVIKFNRIVIFEKIIYPFSNQEDRYVAKRWTQYWHTICYFYISEIISLLDPI